MLRKVVKYCATSTDSTNRIARGHKTFLKIKLISKRRAKNYVHLKNTAIFLENDYKESWICVKDIISYKFSMSNTVWKTTIAEIVFWVFDTRIYSMPISNISYIVYIVIYHACCKSYVFENQHFTVEYI